MATRFVKVDSSDRSFVPDYCLHLKHKSKSSSLEADFERLMMLKKITAEVVVLFLESTQLSGALKIGESLSAVELSNLHW